MSNSDVQLPVTVARIERSEIRSAIEKLESSRLPGFHFVQPGYEKEKGSGTPADALSSARTSGCGARHGRSGLRRPSAIGRARLPAFHHGSSQGVCGPLVRSGPGFVGNGPRGGCYSALPTSSDAPRAPVVVPAGMMPGPPGSKADEAPPAGTALAPAARHHPAASLRAR